MAMHQEAVATEAIPAPAVPLVRLITAVHRSLSAWIVTCADYWDAAATYEQLSPLSDAELARRGLSRMTLAQHVCTACDRSGDA